MWIARGPRHVYSQQCAHVQHEDGTERHPGVCTKHEFPRHIMHGTTVANALEILVDGSIRPSPGICGHGIYGFFVEMPLDDDTILRTFQRCATGGYNRGAAFILECSGILAKLKADEVVPPGVVSLGEKKREGGLSICSQSWQRGLH